MDSNFFLNNALVPFATALAGSVGGEIFKPIFHVFDNWFYLKFGFKVDLEKRKKELFVENELLYYEHIQREKHIGLLKKELFNAVKQIPEYKLRVPDRQTVFSIMDNFDYFINSEELILFYVNMLSATANKDYEVHPRIADSIKYLTPNEFLLLEKLASSMGFIFKVDTNFLTEKFSGLKPMMFPESFPSIIVSSNLGYDQSIPMDLNCFAEKLKLTEFNGNDRFEILEQLNIINKRKLSKRKIGLWPAEILIKIIEEKVAALNVTKHYLNQLKIQGQADDLKTFLTVEVYQLTEFGKNLVETLNPNCRFLFPYRTADDIPVIIPVDSHYSIQKDDEFIIK